MTRVLVTGGTGFIGRHVLSPLLERGYDVHAVARRPGGEQHPGVRWCTADVLDRDQVDLVLDEIRPTHLLHLAWYTDPPQYWSSPENLRWVEGTLRLFERFRSSGGRRAVLAGTCAEYDLDHGYCSEERTPLRPATLYGAAKHAVQVVTAAAGAQFGVSVAWARIFFLYGPAEHPSRLVPSVIRPILAGEPAACSHGRQLRDFLHAGDVASACAALLDSGVEGPVNIGSGVPVSIATVATTIGDLLGRRDLVRLGEREAPPGEPPVILADVSRLRQEVAWQPRLSLEEGMEQTIGWWRQALS